MVRESHREIDSLTSNLEPSRRNLLKIVGTSGLGMGLAGCIGDDDDGDDGDDDADSGDSDGGDDGDDEDDFPSRNFTTYVPYGPGGGFDTYMRMYASNLQEDEYLGQNIQVNNAEGSGGILGHNTIYNADSDGYEFGIILPPSMAQWIFIREEDIDYDLEQMTYLGTVAEESNVILIAADSDIESGNDFVEAMNNEEITLGYSDLTGASGMGVLALGYAGGLYDPDIVTDTAVQIGDRGEQIAAIQRGDINCMAGSTSGMIPYIEDDILRPVILNVTGRDYPPGIPEDTDNLEDIGADNPEQIVGMVGSACRRVLAGPPDIPEERANVLRQAIQDLSNDEEFLDVMIEEGREVNYKDAEATRECVLNYVDTWEAQQDVLDELFG